MGKQPAHSNLQKRAFMQQPENKAQNILMADISPKTLLAGENPRLIDEWQLAPKLWDAVRF